jgi:multidrug efflux system membrane fusion protein
MKRKLAPGSLLTVDNQIDPTTGTVKLGDLSEHGRGALPKSVVARLLVAATWCVPTLQRSPQSAFVYVVKPDHTVEARNIEVQGSEGDQTAISRGLSAGEIVVTDGVDRLQPGMKVVVRAPDKAGS